ncbi:protein SENSITIVITY TO RED LIGHT REDUCED 1 [Impatiens glandulifera]|uniref:protein SENSITIVITY TO RED LIGHT REDUCED 1 n=1 Tax=Impatiens glandulifera TaxID=253017 RepID=UPI001FB0FF32|nr:protein SENSITIVITY TO RED LIGHT REDUCED 1 [Impatiens glandulifera]
MDRISAESITLGKSSPIEGWTVVMNRRKKRRNKDLPKSGNPNPPEVQPASVVDLEVNPERESRLLQKMMLYIKKVETSDFYSTFIHQIGSPEVQNSILRDLNGESKMKMVIYGIGSIESYESPRLQLSLAILMKKSLGWIGDVEVFDPIISLTESRVMETLGCSVLSVNEEGRREAVEKVLFFMPHCDSDLYDHLLETNWGLEKLKNIIILGNSFEKYEQHALLMRNPDTLNSRKHILAAMKFTKEVKINSVLDAFHDLSWHSFHIIHTHLLQLSSIQSVN